MTSDPVETNPLHYRVLFENERVRVLEYTDEPGDATTTHEHPDSVMVTLSSFRRRLVSEVGEFETELPANAARWLPAQTHRGENIGSSNTHTIFVELKEPSPVAADPDARVLGPVGS